MANNNPTIPLALTFYNKLFGQRYALVDINMSDKLSDKRRKRKTKGEKNRTKEEKRKRKRSENDDIELAKHYETL